MGSGWHATCNKCGHGFEVRAGVGMLGTGSLYCDRCGRTHEVDMVAKPDSAGPLCECGGTFTDDANPQCPECGSTEQTRDPSLRILWD